jgi:hypothetical protein
MQAHRGSRTKLDRTTLRVTAVLCVLVLLVAAAGCSQQVAGTETGSETTNGRVAGVVRDTAGRGVGGADVALLAEDSSIVPVIESIDSTVTADNGAFVFDDIDLGRYYVRATRDSLVSFSRELVLSPERSALTLNDTLQLQAAVSGSVSGFLVDPVLLRVNGTPFQQHLSPAAPFTIGGVEPGIWTIEALVTKGDYTDGVLLVRKTIDFGPGMIVDLGTVAPPVPADSGRVRIDDFEDGDGLSLLDGVWWTYNDMHADGDTRVEVYYDSAQGAGGSRRAALLRFAFGGHEPDYAGIGVNLSPDYAHGAEVRPGSLKQVYDLTGLQAVHFAVKGHGGILRVYLGSAVADNVPYLLELEPIPSQWSSIRVDLVEATAALTMDELLEWKQERRLLSELVFQVTNNGPAGGELFIDDIELEF